MLTSVRSLIAATALTGCALATTPVFADEAKPSSEITVTGNVAFVTDYRIRGLSQSSGDPAIQGGINVNHASGFYAGLWSSSTSFDVLDKQFATTAYTQTYGSQELDLFAGWSGSVTSDLIADVGLIYYAYPNGHFGDAEYFELYASISDTLGPVTAKVGTYYAWRQQSLNFNGGKKDDNLYVYGELSAAIPNSPVVLSGHLGYTKGALSPTFLTGETATYDGGLDWNVGATFAITKNLSLTGQYVGVEGAKIDGYSDDALVGTLKLSF